MDSHGIFRRLHASSGVFRCLQGLGLLVCKAPKDNQQGQALAEVKDESFIKIHKDSATLSEMHVFFAKKVNS